MSRSALPSQPAGPAWKDSWLPSTAQTSSQTLWRGVEAQHIVATMRLVDTLDEQAVLEDILEASKPALPTARTSPLPHYLLFTPFRYRSPFASRFRRADTTGVWYGAETVQAAAAEVAYWRWRFLTESTGTQDAELHTQHTFFQARVQGRAIDLTQPPWSALQDLWTQDRDYRATHTLADAAHSHGLDWLRYASVCQSGTQCGAVFNVAALTLHQPHRQQTWHCKTTAHSVWLVREQERYAWTF